MHRWSSFLFHSSRGPADAEVASHKFLLRAGYIRQLARHLQLPVPRPALDEQDHRHCAERWTALAGVYLPAILPRELWEQSGRWTAMGDNMFRLKDRKAPIFAWA